MTWEDAWIEQPDSEAIARRLNAGRVDVCDHDRDPCYLRCGVRRNRLTGRWQAIPYAERAEWRSDVRAAMAAEKARQP